MCVTTLSLACSHHMWPNATTRAKTSYAIGSTIHMLLSFNLQGIETYRMGIDKLLLRNQILLHVGAFRGRGTSHGSPGEARLHGVYMHEGRGLHMLRRHSVERRGRVGEWHHPLMRRVHHGARGLETEKEE